MPEATTPVINNIPELIAQMSKINRYHTELFGDLAKPAQPRTARSLLDRHDDPAGSHLEQHAAFRRQPAAADLAAAPATLGAAIGHTRDKPTMANLLVTLMDKMDVPVSTRWQHGQALARHHFDGLKQ